LLCRFALRAAALKRGFDIWGLSGEHGGYGLGQGWTRVEENAASTDL
jgi:hypothetical protein